ncbi:putative disease resistance protein RGA4 [Mercurialis annua]|uniref:putative disease resistance protein RGA4 n=1 Tax=Mercurialis annua TaxID=3986 RepID=UPI0024AF0E0E|nr:putative disease resistance protein RGA4 [Mercurialis annua]
MGDALVSALASTILTNLNSLIHGETAGSQSELQNLESTLTTIQAVLHDAEEQQWKSEAVKNWLRKLKDAAYEADDLFDEIALETQWKRLPKTLPTHVRCFFSDPNPVFFKVKMSHKLRNVREKLDGIAREKNKFHLREEVTVGDRDIAGILDWRQTSSLVNELEIIGRNKEKAELISMLLANSEHLSVYAICGMGGLGKTTLAQLVYNDETIKGHYRVY